MRPFVVILCCALLGFFGCTAARNRLDQTVTFTEKATGAFFTGLGGAVVEGLVELPFNILDHAVDEAIDPDHDCNEDPHDVCNDDDEYTPPTTGVVSDEFSDWKD